MANPIVVALTASVLTLSAAGCQKHADHSGSAAEHELEGSPRNALMRRVAARKVCMANDRYMVEDQIPVRVGDKTYYGFCPACEKRLNDEAPLRSAVDPVSRRPVDKATAVIGKLKDGRVLYFESESTYAAYRGGG